MGRGALASFSPFRRTWSAVAFCCCPPSYICHCHRSLVIITELNCVSHIHVDAPYVWLFALLLRTVGMGAVFYIQRRVFVVVCVYGVGMDRNVTSGVCFAWRGRKIGR